MAEIGRGLKAGILAGVIMGLLSGIITAMLMFTILHDEYLKIFEATISQANISLQAEINPETILMIGAVGGIISGLIMGLIIGAIIGLIYAVLYNTIPGKTAITKGIATGLIYFVIITILSLLEQAVFPGTTTTGIDPGLLSLMANIGYATNFITALIFGYLLGWFWNRFKPKEN